MLGLLGYDGEDYDQEPVLQKIEKFVNCVAHRAILDMFRVGQHEELVVMWYNLPIDKALKTQCDEVLCKEMVARKDIDVGWTMLGLEYEAESIAVLQPTVDIAIQVLTEFRRMQLHCMY